jgi:Domain of unknown function DUF11/Beta-propeller repeat
VRLNRRGLEKSGVCAQSFFAMTLLTLIAALALAFDPGLKQLSESGSEPWLAPAQASSNHRPGLSAYGHLPLMFEANRGQTDPKVKFLARGSGYVVFLTSDEAVLKVQQSAGKHTAQTVLRMQLAGANGDVSVTGADQLAGRSNYLIGNDPTKWRRNIPQFSRVRYEQVYPGVDLVYYGNQGQLEYDFQVAAGADPRQIVLKFSGVSDGLRLDSNGDLMIPLGNGDIRLKSPAAYQRSGSGTNAVASRFKLHGKNEVGFVLGSYDHRRSLVIDPVLSYSTYLGGSGQESCSTVFNQPLPSFPGTPGCPAITADPVGEAYVAGLTTSPDFPGISSASYQKNLASGATANVFVAKFSAAGSTLEFATYLGGNGLDYTAGVAVDSAGNVYVAGTTTSSNFPTTASAFQTSATGKHVFVSELNSVGQSLLYSTYLAGNGTDIASGMALDSSANVYVTGTTTSTNVVGRFPATFGAFQTTPALGSTIQFYMTKVSTLLAGTASVPYSTYFGGGNSLRPASQGPPAVGGGIAVDLNSNVYITGGTSFLHIGGSNDFPILNAYQACLDTPPTTITNCPTNVTAYDAFVAKINPTLIGSAQLLYSTYLGGSLDDIGYGVAVDTSLDSYVTGSTASIDFNFTPLSSTSLFQSTNAGGVDAFLVKLGILCTGSSCVTTTVPMNYFTYLGGSGTDIGTAIAVDSIQGARITGWTNSLNFPSLNNPVQPAFGGGATDAFVARIDTTATTSSAPGHYATFLGGSGSDAGTSIAVDPQNSSYTAGETSSTNFPITNPAQGTLNGPNDAFVTKFGPLLDLSMQVSATPSTVGVGSQASFAYDIANNGDAASNLVFTDTLPTGGVATFVSATASPGSCGSATGNVIGCTIGTLNAGATATVTVILTPVAASTPATAPTVLGNSGAVSATGSGSTTASGSVVVNDFTLTMSPATATVPAGVPATYTATVTPTGYIPESVSLACGSGLPTGATCTATTNPFPSLTGPQSSTLVIATTSRVTTTTHWWHERGFGAPAYAAWLPISGLALLGVGARKNSYLRRVLLGIFLSVFLALMLFLGACGKSSVTTTSGTPAGTYEVTVNATSGTATRTTTVTLVVQ